MKNIERLDYLDVARGISILCIVLGHIRPQSIIGMWLFSFHVPVFFVITGMLQAYKKQNGVLLELHIKKLIRNLLIPYIFFSIINIVISWLLGNEINIKSAIYSLIIGRGSHATWFLSALFISEIIFPYILKINDAKIRHIIIIVLFVISVEWHPGGVLQTFYKSFIGCTYMYVGFSLYKIFLDKLIKWKYILLGVIINFLSLYINYKYIKIRADLFNLVFGNIFIYIIGALSGSYALIAICKITENIPILIKKYIRFYGCNSMIVQCTHLHMVLFISKYCSIENIYFKYILVFILTILLEVPIIYLFKKYFYFFIGHNKPAK